MNHIIGSGLSAFSFCYFSGKKSIIYEKEDYFGGRIQSQKYSKNFIEGGAQFYSKEDPNIYGLIKEINLEKNETRVSLSKFFAKRDSEFIPIKNASSSQLTPVEQEQLRLFYDKILETLKIVDTAPLDLFFTPFNKWYIKNIGKETEWIINGMMRAITFTDPKNQSALYGIIVCGTFFSDCYSINGGLTQLNKTLINLSKPVIKLNQKVTHINFVKNYAKSIEIDEKVVPIEKNNLVSTIPSNELSKIVPDSELSKYLKKITYNGCAVLILETNKKLLNHDSGILYTNKRDKVSVMIDESKYYNFKSKENILGLLFPYNNNRPTEKYLIKKAIEKIEEITDQDFRILHKNIFYWDYGLPEFNKRNIQLQQKINKSIENYANFSICGDFMGFPSLDACVESARNAAYKLK
jgi:protoporphyrinogen oxidase